MQAVIEGARDHGQARAGLLVERPEAEVEAIEIVKESSDSAQEEILRGAVFSGEEVIVDSPERPDESVQDVSGRRDDVFLEPEVAGFVGEGNAAIRDRMLKADEGAAGCVEISWDRRFLCVRGRAARFPGLAQALNTMAL